MKAFDRLVLIFLAVTLLQVGASGKDPKPKSVTSAPAAHSTSAPSTSRPQVVDFSPGLRIDYRVPQVEIDAEVILREGSLELFLYSKSPTPKEHESILRTRVPSLRIYQALGLAGFKPGQTTRYFEESGKVRPPSGDPVNVLVRFERDGQIVEEPANEWMLDVHAKSTMRATNWLFTGSERTETGEFAADMEGTVITVVDFPSSLLSMPASHTSSDTELWLKANTSRIPSVGTKVVVVLRSPGTAAIPLTQPG